MSEPSTIVAQLVMKDEDGTSILTKDAGRAETASTGNLSPERVKAIETRLEELGFEVLSSNPNTLSITGPEAVFAQNFGASLSQMQRGEGRFDSAQMAPDLAPFVADVFVPPAPQTFP